MGEYDTDGTGCGNNSSSIIVGLVFVVLASLAAWVFAPKGENQTLVTPYLSESLLCCFGYLFCSKNFPKLTRMDDIQTLAQLAHPRVRGVLFDVGYVYPSFLYICMHECRAGC